MRTATSRRLNGPVTVLEWINTKPHIAYFVFGLIY